MKEATPYLIFDGHCREAVTFYQQCLDAQLYMMPYSDMPGGAPPGVTDRIIHARLMKKGVPLLMASDSTPDKPVQQGNHVFISLNCESAQEVERLFTALGERGNAIMPVQETFWAVRFGMLTDRFGINWMFNFEKPKQA